MVLRSLRSSGALVSVRWLLDALSRSRPGSSPGSGLRLLDASWYLPEMKRDGPEEFVHAHIPGAAHFDIDTCSDRSSRFDHTLPGARHFADYVGALGVGTDSHVVVYDASDFGAFSCTRVWWMFRAFGHARVSVLDGGLRAWLRSGGPVSAGLSPPRPARFSASLDPNRLRSFQDVTRNISTREFQLVDVRPRERFRGLEPEPREGVPPGHVPGSLCMPFTDFLDSDGLFLPPEDLRALFERSGVDLARPLVATCGSGVTACHLLLAAHLCGAALPALYDGSWYEWVSRAPPQHIASEA